MIQSFFYWVFVTIFRFYSKLFLILIVRGRSTYDGPCIYVANHPNVFDPMYLLPRIKKRLTVLITEHAFRVPVFGALLRFTKQIEVAHPPKGVFQEALRRLKKGESILLFPEGDCDEGKKLLPFHTGAVRLAMETGYPIIPIGIYLDPVRIWRRKTTIGSAHIIFTWYRYGWYAISFGQPWYLHGSVSEKKLVLRRSVLLRGSVKQLMASSKAICKYSMRQGKRKAKQRFHQVVRFSYRMVCLLFFAKVH